PGVSGATGPTGATGATGTAGLSGVSRFSASTSATPARPTTVLGGVNNAVTILPLSGVNTTNGIVPSGGVITLAGTTTIGQPLVSAGTITGISANVSITQAMALVGTTITMQAQVWRADPGSNGYVPIPGAVATLAPPLTGIVGVGTLSMGTTSGLSIPVVAQNNLIVVVSATVTAGIDMATTVEANVGVSVNIA
ncbi:MAG: hypothetical protein Q7T55_14070, partial [Solirubrobacteraceae bacterium]|nr:hypothetical protein [Solirubrobacteraceae bacterium]